MNKIRKTIVNTLFYGGLEEKDFANIQDLVSVDNRKTAIVWSALSTLYWTYCFIMSFADELYRLCRTVYVVALIAAVISIILSVLFAHRSKYALTAVLYILRISLIFAGVGIAYCQPGVRSVTMFVMAVVIPICFIDRTISTILLVVAQILAYSVFTVSILSSDLFYFGLVTLFIFSSLGVVMGHHINKSRYERFKYSKQVECLAEEQRQYANHDEMTGLLNRRAYILKVDALMLSKADDHFVVMADLNGLKRANDNIGHDAGDELLIATADSLKKAFEEYENTDRLYIYRTGGDEFCVLFKGTQQEIDVCLEKLDRVTKEWKGKLADKLSLSWGYAKCEDGDIDTAFRAADQMMYENKKIYYQQSGIERRRGV